MRAGIYVRISKDVAGEGLGVARQEQDCRERAATLGWEVVDVYVDNDISATSGKVRPSYRRMLDDLERGDITAIVAWHPDRLYRRVPDLYELVETCKKASAQVETVNAGHVDLSSPTGRMVAGILAQVAMYEVEHKSERWARSWRQGRESGAPVTNSNRLYGYERDGETIVPSEAAVVRDILTRLLAGESLGSVTRWLSDNGHRTTCGNVWTMQGVKRMLTNPRLAGYSTLNGEIVAEGTWPAVVDRAEWETLRALLSARTRAYVPRKYLLNGLLFCGKCQTRMVAGAIGGNGQYRCPARAVMGGCGGVVGVSARVDEVVERFAALRLGDPDVRERIEALRSEPSGAQNELAALELRVRELEKQLDEPGTPVTTLLRAIDRARERQAGLVEQLAAAPRGMLPPRGGAWPEDLVRRRALVDMVVKRIELAPSGPTNRFKPERVLIEPRH